MSVQFSNPEWLWLFLAVLPWVVWLAVHSDASLSLWRQWLVCFIRIVIATALVLAMAGIQWLDPREGMNVMFLLDRSQSVPEVQQEAARRYINEIVKQKEDEDQAGVLVFGGDAGIEQMVQERVELGKIQAVVQTDRTDIAAAIRLGTATFPEHGQKRLVLLSDGNENLGESLAAVAAVRPLEVSVDVIPLGAKRRNDISLQRLTLPGNVKRGTTFEAKIFAQSDESGLATVRLFRNNRLLGEQEVSLEAGKNLFTFPQSLPDSGFYTYDVEIAARGDMVAQNNRAISFVNVVGDPRILVVSDQPAQDRELVAALISSHLDVSVTDLSGFPESLAEMQSYDAIFLSNIAAGDLGNEAMRRLESAVRDFGVGLACVGGDQTYAAGGYRGTPLERALPLDMELSSKKVLPSGALAMVMHGMEFNNGNQVARKVAVGVLDALGPQDELGIVLWDGSERWLFPMTKAANKRALSAQIMGMNQGDLPSFQNVMAMAFEGLKKSTANLKHMIVFSDGDPGAPSEELMAAIRGQRVTVSTVLIAGHAGPETMQWIAKRGRGRFYDVRSPDHLPQIFIKETAVILKSAISENPFTPKRVASSELIRGIDGGAFPQLLGHVATTPKGRAEVPLVTESGDPLLAHWQYGLGRAVAFTSDARAKWATHWLSWDQYRQFWSQIAQWALRRVESTDFATEATIDKGIGTIAVEAVDDEGNFRNFLELNARVVRPSGEGEAIRLKQTAPGRYEAQFEAREVGAYTMNLMHMDGENLLGTQMAGTSLSFSPEYARSEPQLNLLGQLAEMSGGKVFPSLGIAANPFAHNRLKTFQPNDLWEWFLKLAILLFPLDVALRRVQADRADLARAYRRVISKLLFWRQTETASLRDESLSALLNRRDQVRARQVREMSETGTLGKPLVSSPRAKGPFTETIKTPKSKGVPADSKTLDSEEDAEEPQSTTSRLLIAKRKAQQKR
ncbi:MAG: hypothetical protein M2R45_04276 [Verrucomicrobia subdivision 3 bacterium]|nr:hypothetical protein [Limisphaerales bacterium]MCS1417383.1 hypothetical protein [Limisphaerales bacterium]